MAKPLTEILKMLSGGSIDGEAGKRWRNLFLLLIPPARAER